MSLEIPWEFRLKPDLSLYRSALVNLLIACVADIRKYPNKSKFVHESIDLMAQIRRNSLGDE